MARLLQGRKKRLILDIGASAIRLCELAQTKTGYQLTKFYQKEYNSDPALEEEIRRNLRRNALQELLKEAKSRTKRTLFAVPGQSVFTRTRALPPVPDYKVTQIVKYEIQQQIPFALDQIAMDYQILDRTEAGGYDVMMAAIKVDVVDKHIDILQSAKRSVDVVDVCPFAAYNWLKHTGEFGDQGECVALIDMGAATTDIVIERGNQFRFTRPLNIGGNDITQAIAATFAMNFVDAERVKRERAFAPTGDAKRDGKGGEAIGQVLHRLVSEIVRSFAYFRSLPGGGQVNRVILCGGGACLRNIIPYMQRQLGLEVRIAQPLAGLAIAPAAQQVSDRPEQACVVLGLALRNRETVPLEINLIPPRVLEAVRRKEQVFYWALSLSALALVMASIIPAKANDNKSIRLRIEALKKVITQYDPELGQKLKIDRPIPVSELKRNLTGAQSTIQSLQSDVAVLDKAREARTFWLDELALINEARPPAGGIWFSAVETTFIQDKQLAATAPARRAPRSEGGGLRGGFRGSTGTAQQQDFMSTGFPGIGRQTAAGMPSGGILSRRPAEGSRVGRRTGEPAAPEIFEANGMIVRGFAKSDEIIQNFVQDLKGMRRDVPNGQRLSVQDVKFSEASVQKCSQIILRNAPITDVTAQTDRGTGAGAWPLNEENSVYSFRVDVLFTRGGDAPPPPASRPPEPSAAS